jgi:type I restriction enzyme S subunit
MMEGWKEYRLEEVADVIMGQSPPSKYYNEKGSGLPFFQGKTEFRELFPTIRQYTNKITKEAEKDSVLFTVRAPVGELNITKVKCCIGRGLAAINAKNTDEQRFIYYTIKVNREAFLARSYGAVYDAISGPDLRKTKLFLPEKSEIRLKIATILSAYDNLIENNLKRIKLLEEMAQKTYEEWFVRFKIDGVKLTIDEKTGLPEGWRKVKLGDACNLTMGQSPKSEFYNIERKGLPFHQGVKDYGERFPTNTMWSINGNRVAEKGDVLFSVRAPVGRLNIAINKIILGRGLASVRHKNGWNGFLFNQLKQIFFEDNLMGGGAIFNSVTKNDMLRIELIEGNENTMQKFNHIVIPIDKEIENLHIQNQHLKEARDILLPRLMMGMINVEKLNLYQTNEESLLNLAAESKAKYATNRN